MTEWRKHFDEQWLRLAKAVDEGAPRAARRSSGFDHLLRAACVIAPLLGVAASLEGPAATGRPVQAAGGEMEIEMQTVRVLLVCATSFTSGIEAEA
jgi:hypothetical protein